MIEPEKFFIGLMEFFSILLPGALISWLLQNMHAGVFEVIGDPHGTQGWIVFLFSSYLFGHFIFLIGSWLLDDHLYDPVRDATYDRVVSNLAKGGEVPSRWRRWAAESLFKNSLDYALRHVVMIKEARVENVDGKPTINAFQWSKAYIATQHPEAMPIVQRFEADSKFFRSLVVVLCAIMAWAASDATRWWLALACLSLLALALWRYIDQRAKAINQAYYFVITLESERVDGFRQRATPNSGSPTHAGGVVYKRTAETALYLLVETTREPVRLVLPKGHIEPWESARETAVREVREEAGVWARVRGQLEEVTYDTDSEHVIASFYLMEWLEGGEPDEPRKPRWVTLQQALSETPHPETRDLLLAADRLQQRLDAIPEATKKALKRQARRSTR